MVFIGLKISFRIFDSNSLKAKRSVMKSITNSVYKKYNVSIAEVDAQDMLNQGVIAIGVVGNQHRFCRKLLDTVLTFIEEKYNEIEVYEVEQIEV